MYRKLKTFYVFNNQGHVGNYRIVIIVVANQFYISGNSRNKFVANKQWFKV